MNFPSQPTEIVMSLILWDVYHVLCL